MKKDILTYTDDLGIIGHKREDGVSWDFGDACARTYSAEIFKYLNVNEKTYRAGQALILSNLLYVFWADAQPLRYPKRPDGKNFAWWSMLDRFTRDQLIPMLVGTALSGNSDGMWRITKTMLKRFGVCWNKWKIGGSPEEGFTPTVVRDVLGPSTWNVMLRYWVSRCPFALQLLLRIPVAIIDLWSLLQVLFRIYKGFIDSDDTGDDLNITHLVKHSEVQATTPVAKFTSYIYFKYRPLAGSPIIIAELKPENGVVSAWQSYFYSIQAAPLDEIAHPSLKFGGWF